MALSRRETLQAVRTGDVIHGVTESGQQKLLLVYETDRSRIRTRHVTTQEKIDFGSDGQSLPAGRREGCRITSAASLRVADYETTIGLDHKMRTGKEHPDFVLSRSEIDLLLTVHDFYKAHPLPAE
jgi:hypothetical protein